MIQVRVQISSYTRNTIQKHIHDRKADLKQQKQNVTNNIKSPGRSTEKKEIKITFIQHI